jgi:hypothetical protein
MRRLAFPAEDQSQLLSPEQLLPAYLYLLGPDSHGITGQQFEMART